MKPGEVLDKFNVFLEEFTLFLIYIKNQKSSFILV